MQKEQNKTIEYSPHAYDPELFAFDFDEKTLLTGCELALSGEMLGRFSENGNELCRGAYFGQQIGSKYTKILARIYLDPKYGDLVRTRCDCREFRKDGFSCRHIAAVLLDWQIKKDGISFLRGTDLEKNLKDKYQVEDPFVPGLLRKTDHKLRKYMKNALSGMKLPDWDQVHTGSAAATGGKLGIAYYLKAKRGGFSVECRAGFKRKYVIKQLDGFLESLRTGGEFSFGKENIYIDRNSLHEKDQKALEVLQVCDQEVLLSNFSINYYKGDIPGQTYRVMTLGGKNADAFLEQLSGLEVYLDEKPVMVDLDRKMISAEMEKQDHGATLRISGGNYLSATPEWTYLLDNQVISRLPASQGQILKTILQSEPSQTEKELYIAERDIPSISQTLLPALQELGEVQIKGELPQLLEKEVPSMDFYLDLVDEGMVSCKPMANYRNAGLNYCLFDKDDQKKLRNAQAETETARCLGQLFDAYDEKEKLLLRDCKNENELFAFLTDGFKALHELGELLISDRLKKIKIRPVSSVKVGVDVQSGVLNLSLASDNMSNLELAEILSSYRRKQSFFRLKNGDFFTFDEKSDKQWAELSELYKAYGKKNPEAMKVPLFRAMYLDDVLKEKEGISLEKSEKYRNLLEQMDFGQEETKVPDSLEETLRGYQKEGFHWLNTLKKNGFGGILADEMGLGKTLQVLAFLLAEKKSGKSGDQLRTLIVTPASLIYNWKKEVERFTPELTAKVIAGTAATRKKMTEQKDQADIWITSYDLLKRDAVLYEVIPFANQFIDEAQYIKNPTTQAAKAVKVIESSFRVALTGTPIENRLSELWSIFDYLMPGFLYSYSRFMKEYETPIVNDKDEDVMDRLRTMTHPFILRRLKKDVLKDLPDKLEQVITVEMDKEQRKLYDAHAQRLKMFLDKQSPEEFSKGKLEILAELTKLRQLCCGPELLFENYKGGNAKLEACMELVSQALDGGHRMLIFSQFTSMLDLICKKLEKEGIEYYRIDGSTTKEDRARMADAFGQTEVKVFCISLKAGGVGLNLTAADIVIHYDPWWNVAAQNQATDRAHRIGQENEVAVYQLIADKTIEEQITSLQKAKAELAQEVLSGEGIHSILIDKEDVLKLL